MLKVARHQANELEQSGDMKVSGAVSCRTMDVHDLHAVKTDAFDTVIDTFGVCSMERPVVALRELARVCKRDGHILMLEHGRSRYAWLNRILDDGAHSHARKWGCWWNREIPDLVREAGLEIVEHDTYNLGTTHMIVAKKRALD
eukprot:TRINITY_DN5901_c0_g1_i2.p1 TRINITY_DN5901_c0_g1~~TRINITY_DN5901_c0_g1_i2.p1  ORF type:complete len:144 (-),score=71.88 TRINITY_DN5901_c0_g1_i2:88-519(-)